ncbi:MAG: hypothetical protein SGJ05_05605 [bacterium]|nr:hypothetical protein [bacterium]
MIESILAALLIVSASPDTTTIMRSDSSLRHAYRVEATIGGLIQATRYPDKPTQLSNSNVFPGTTFFGRLMWHPDHLLSVGVYSGFVTFSREKVTAPDENGVRQDITLDLTGIPAQVVFAMQPGNFQFGLGLGVYFLTSHTTVNNAERFSSSDYEYGVSSWLAYDFRLHDAITLGPEIGLHVLSNMGVTCAMVGVRFKVDMLTY